MTTTTTAFFATEQNRKVVSTFSAVLQQWPQLDPQAFNITRPLKGFFQHLVDHPTAFDRHCPFNIEHLGERYIGRLSAFITRVEDDRAELMRNIFVISYRFACELEFSRPGNLSFDFPAFEKFVSNHLEQFDVDVRQQLVYASYTMPASMAKRLIHDCNASLGPFKDFVSAASAATRLKAEWDIEIKKKMGEIETLSDVVARIKTNYNFVGLVNGFENLVTQKKKESCHAFAALCLLGVIMLIPVTAQLCFVLTHIEEIDTHHATLLYSLPTLLTLEVILLYFFRVVLSNYRSLKSQLLQLDLRVSLCQFIESYSEYSTKIKQTDPAALDRFEALVFSGVTSEGGNIPTTFDGIDQITKLMKSVRGQ
jgi:hypothetical protein